MQNLLLIPIALSMPAGQKPEYNIKGRFTDFKNNTMILQSCKVDDILRDSNNPDLYIRKDTVVVRNGQLNLQWTVEQPTYFSITPRQAFLQIPGGQRWFQTISDINFFLSKGESVDFIAGIACNDTEQNRQKAVIENALSWINVINPRNLPTDQNLSIKYGIEAFPTKIILDPDGRIASVVVGESPEFYTKPDSLFK